MKKSTLIMLIIIAVAIAAQAEPRHRHESKRNESHNYIIERQEAGQVSGVPTMRRIIGSREIDIYRDGSMYEKNNLVGIKK